MLYKLTIPQHPLSSGFTTCGSRLCECTNEFSMSGPSQPIHQGEGDILILTKMMVIISISQTIPLTRKTLCQSSGPFVEKTEALHLSVSSERGKNIRYEIGFGLVGGEDVQKIWKMTNTLRWPQCMHRKAHRQTCLEFRQSLERIPSCSSLKWLFVCIVLKCATAKCAVFIHFWMQNPGTASANGLEHQFLGM